MCHPILFTVALFLICVLPASLMSAEDLVMGNWEGKLVARDGREHAISAKVVADGGGKYHAVIEMPTDEGTCTELVVEGERKNGFTQFAADERNFRARIETDVLTGECDRGTFTMKRVAKAPPTLGAPPAEGAVVLFDGTSLSEWTHAHDTPPAWKLIDGAMEAGCGAIPSKHDPKKKVRSSLFTKRQFGDIRLHLEFCCPFKPDKRNQARGNSGVFLPNGSEIQVLDSFGKKPAKNECGAIYGEAPARVMASLPPLEWQTYDVDFTAPRFDERKKLIKPARVTVRHNGILIHDDYEIQKKKTRPRGPILLQDHGNPVRYRNIWVVPKDQ